MEKRIERIWCEVIGCQNIGRNDDFYSIGGDSLLIAQAISKMIQNLPEAKNWKWDALMMEMMKNATIRGIAEKLQNNFVTKVKKRRMSQKFLHLLRSKMRREIVKRQEYFFMLEQEH